LAFIFCDCFLGDRENAATAAQDAFAAFLLDSRETGRDRVPLMLLQYALRVALDQSSQARPLPGTDALEMTIPQLPAAERAVFILRGILDLAPFEVALIARTTSDEVHKLWTDSLLHLRALWR
jgi:DNA-directed RNA polymerase specialized sigma24 family protein